METNKNRIADLQAEFDLSGVMYNVCQFLDIKDLYSVAKVCRSWHQPALHEMQKKGPDLDFVPFFNKLQVDIYESKFNLLDIMRVKPHIALLFHSKMDDDQISDLNYVINTYKEHLECNVIAVCVDNFSWLITHSRTEEEEALLFWDGWTDTAIPSLLLPIFKQSGITVSCCMKKDDSVSVVSARRMYKELIQSNQDSNIILIILTATRRGSKIAKNLLEIIETNHEQTACSIWGRQFNQLRKQDYSCNTNTNINKPIFVGIRIFGPSIKSWSFVIDTSLCVDALIEQINRIKQSVKLNRYSVGLFCNVPSIYGEVTVVNDKITLESKINRRFLDALSNVFPKTWFFIEHADKNLKKDAYGWDSTSNDGGVMANSSHMSLMIMTYN